jgi:hypothetical protein
MTRNNKNPVSTSEKSESILEEELPITNGKEAVNPSKVKEDLAKAKPKANTQKKSVKSTTKKKLKTSRSPSVTKPTIRKVPMTHYCSKTKELTLYRQVTIDGSAGKFDEIVIPLEELNEDERQLVIKTAKLAVTYAKLHNPTIEPSNDGTKGKSLFGKLMDSIKRVASYHKNSDVPVKQDKEVTRKA